MKDHRAGDTWPGHLWVIQEGGTSSPQDVTDWEFTLTFYATGSCTAKPVWVLSSDNASAGVDLLNLMDGDGRTVALDNGESLLLSPAGYPYIVEASPAVPPMGAGEYTWIMKSKDAQDWEQTLETGRLKVLRMGYGV